ncbi:family 10 glycosylhydrolase [Paenibacillus larvae]|nr:family 10 glycosylhydrolase [Paenibacillus larvae]
MHFILREYAPWSEYLTGTQGKSPGYDPLAFMVEEAHKRNLEFHAWFNPLPDQYPVQSGQVIRESSCTPASRLGCYTGAGFTFNPGLPEVKQYITNSVLEVNRNYDIDLCSFGRLLLSHPVKGKNSPICRIPYIRKRVRQQSGLAQGHQNQLVKDLSHEIKSAKTYVKFGISPFGVWRNKSSDPNGSDTRALSVTRPSLPIHANGCRKNGRLWRFRQVYWSFDFSAAQYNKVTECEDRANTRRKNCSSVYGPCRL